MNNLLLTILIIMTIIVIVLLLTVIMQENKLKSFNALKIKHDVLSKDYEKLKEIKDNYSSAINITERRAVNAEKQVETVRNLINKLTNKPLKYLRFKTQNGEIVNTVKLKSIIKDKKVIDMKATVRRNVNNKYQDVKVTPFFDV